ncbi:MAG: hypothetical protein LC792_24710, partial [Actinobacteria bacterium]|nr:hypothetical protein [Actinomycetota bacterium]
ADTTRTDPNHPGVKYAQLVTAVAEGGNRLFVAGAFTNLVSPKKVAATPAMPFLAVLDVATGAPVPGAAFNTNAKPDGVIDALAVSADGQRLYVGGAFAHIGGKAVRRLAALSVDTGLADPTFRPPAPNAYVRTLALAGSRLYVGGAFTTVGTGTAAVARPGLAALDAAGGTLLTGFVPPQNYGGVFETHVGQPVEDQPGTYHPGVVDALAATGDGTTLLVGGNFLHFGTAPAADPNHQHGGLVALDAATGALTPWQPVSKRPVFALSVWPGDHQRIFAVAGGAGGVVETYLPGGTKTTPLWTGHVDGDATGVAATASRVYVVGHYDHEVPNASDPCLTPTPQANGQMGVSCPNGTPHRHLAAFDASTGNVDPTFTAQANSPEGPDVAVVGAAHLYVGGNFTKVAATPGGTYRSQPGLAVYDAAS